jgi:hypothetical protein
MAGKVKYALMRAILKACCFKRGRSGIIILTTEPLINAVAELDAPAERLEMARLWHDYQYQAVDMLIGNVSPELGGKPEYLDIVGVNFYYENEWEIEVWKPLIWKDNRRSAVGPLRHLYAEIYERYQKPIALTETSHPKKIGHFG